MLCFPRYNSFTPIYDEYSIVDRGEILSFVVPCSYRVILYGKFAYLCI